MKEVTLSRSWHLWLSNFGTTRIRPEYGTDICEYTRAVIAGAFWAVVAIVALVASTMWLGFSLHNLGDILLNGAGMEIYTFGLLIVCGFVVVLVSIALAVEWLTSRPKKDKPQKPPTFAAVAYHKFKSKTCFKINFAR